LSGAAEKEADDRGESPLGL